MIDTTLTNRCLTQAWDSLHPTIKQWIPADRLRADLAAQISNALAHVDNVTFAMGFHEVMPVPGAAPADYEHKVLDVDRGGLLVAGIRFRLDPSFSFVETYARDVALTHVATMRSILDVTRRAFAMFSPSHLRLHVAAGSIEDQVVMRLPGSIDYLTVAGLVADLHARVPPPHMDRISIALAPSTSFYGRYLGEYEAFHRANPDLRTAVPISSREALDRCRAQGLLYEAFVDGKWAGLIAGRTQTDAGMPGYRIVEELLSTPFRGRRLGPALQRHFIDTLPTADHQVLHGAIHPANTSSLATAKRIGRVEVMRTHLIGL